MVIDTSLKMRSHHARLQEELAVLREIASRQNNSLNFHVFVAGNEFIFGESHVQPLLEFSDTNLAFFGAVDIQSIHITRGVFFFCDLSLTF